MRIVTRSPNRVGPGDGKCVLERGRPELAHPSRQSMRTLDAFSKDEPQVAFDPLKVGQNFDEFVLVAMSHALVQDERDALWRGPPVNAVRA